MRGPVTTGARPLSAASSEDTSALIPCLMLRSGRVCEPGPEGPVTVRLPSGAHPDPFDVVDRLSERYSLLYVVDLNGIEHGDPQLEYLQELARDMALWVDAGIRASDQAIDILVAGAQRAVLSSAYLRGPNALARAWKLSTDLAFEIEMSGAGLTEPAGDWGTIDPVEFARRVRAAGPDHLILSPRETDPDWNVVRAIASEGPTWVDGSFTAAEAAQARAAGAKGGIFHLTELYATWDRSNGRAPASEGDTPVRDDET
jgi:hypothetical protein